MSKVVKKTALIIAIIVAVCAAIWGIIVAINSFKRESVKVFTVSDIAMTDYWGDTSETYGTVSTDNLQKVLVSDSQTISNIYVKEGQSVSKGDKLLAYDTTLSELDVEKATIELNKLKLQLDNAKKELEELIEDQGEAELTCQFCDNKYHFNKKELEDLLEKAK